MALCSVLLQAMARGVAIGGPDLTGVGTRSGAARGDAIGGPDLAGGSNRSGAAKPSAAESGPETVVEEMFGPEQWARSWLLNRSNRSRAPLVRAIVMAALCCNGSQTASELAFESIHFGEPAAATALLRQLLWQVGPACYVLSSPLCVLAGEHCGDGRGSASYTNTRVRFGLYC